MLPPSAYPPLLEAAAHPGALLAAPAPRPPALSWVLARLAPLQLAGAALFLAGNLLQAHSHWLLARLGRGRRPGYKIPRGACGRCGSAAGRGDHAGPAARRALLAQAPPLLLLHACAAAL